MLTQLARRLASVTAPSASRAVRTISSTRSFSAASAASLENLDAYPETKVTTLPNGLRIATESNGGEMATVGLWIDTGSRYESAASNGTAHFLEHMFFKGTAKMSQTQLETTIEDMGAHLNAYTSREQTVFYAQCFEKDSGKCLDILGDILRNSEYSEQNITRERDVILREHEDVAQQIEEHVFDRLHETAFRDQALGRTILGSTDNIKKISRAQIDEYATTHYRPERMVVAGAGAVDHEALVAKATALFGDMKASPAPVTLEKAQFTGSSIEERNDEEGVAHVAYAFQTAGWTDPDHVPLQVAQALLGGWEAGSGSGSHHDSSPLVAAVAQDELCHKFFTFNTQYTDTGLFGVYGVTENTTLHEFMFQVTNAFQELSNGIRPKRLEDAKKRVKVQMLSNLDGSSHVCEDIGRQMLTYGRRMHPAEAVARIDAVTEGDIKAVAQRFFRDQDHAVAARGAIYEMPDYNRLRRRSYQLRM